jgi:hypothetical protein
LRELSEKLLSPGLLARSFLPLRLQAMLLLLAWPPWPRIPPAHGSLRLRATQLLLACLLVCLPTPLFSLYFPQLTCPLFSEQLPCPCSGTKMDENGAGLASVAYGR